MVGLNPAKFYGRLLPRPRIYCDVKFSDSRVDPPESVNCALLEWASEASWKMGGTATKRKRMSGKIEGRMNKLRDMEESDEDDEEAPPLKKIRAEKKRPLSIGKSSPASKHRTPIERMLESPGSAKATKRGKLAPRRIISDDDTVKQAPAKSRRTRKEQAIPESDEDSDDDIEGFMTRLVGEKRTPNRSIRKSSRLQASPTTPDSKYKRSAPESVKKSPLKPVVEDSGSESDSGSGSDSGSESSDHEESESVFL